MSKTKSRNEQIIEEFRANGGKVGGSFKNRDLLLLHTTGAKSGLPRLTPLVTMRDNGRLIVIASKAGAPSHPDWYYNLVANPDVSVEFGTDRFDAGATVIEEPERSELYDKMAQRYAFFKEYAKIAGRIIPVIVLTPKENKA